MKDPIGRLHVITDTTIQRRFGHVELAELAVAGGAEVIQFRDKSLASGALIETAKAVRLVCRAGRVPLVINDRVDIALAVDADGVHLGQRDLPVSVARQILGPTRLIGASASTTEEAVQAERDGADYVGFGHIYPTPSKDKSDPPKGSGPLREACDEVSIPIIAIGGIDVGNLGLVLETGASGVAVISAVCAADDPRSAVTDLMSEIGDRTGGGSE
jgi:thiamine-phosphate pyrophosphorylase